MGRNKIYKIILLNHNTFLFNYNVLKNKKTIAVAKYSLNKLVGNDLEFELTSSDAISSF